MRLFVGGARGSRPAIGDGFSEFGGHTTSFLLIGSEGQRLVIDAGSGMQAVAEQLTEAGPGEVTVLFSHYHLDHMFGLTMNPLFYQPDWSFRFVGPVFGHSNVRDAVTHLMSPPYWPITCDRMAAQITFLDFPDTGLQMGSLSVKGLKMPHPNGCMTYRIEDSADGASLVYATDIEWANRTEELERMFMKSCKEPRPADMLYIDSHFARVDADVFAGMGHTCWEDCVDIARSAGVKRLFLGHYAPESDDRALQKREQEARQVWPNVEPARAGVWLEIGERS